MIFKSSTVALVISSVLAVSANANDAQNANNQLSVGKPSITGVFIKIQSNIFLEACMFIAFG